MKRPSDQMIIDERDALREEKDSLGRIIVDMRRFVGDLEKDNAALRKRVSELETSLHEARMLLPYEWRKEPE